MDRWTWLFNDAVTFATVRIVSLPAFSLCLNRSNADKLIELIQRHVSEVEPPKTAANEVTFRLPFSASPAFPALFSALDSDIKNGVRRKLQCQQ